MADKPLFVLDAEGKYRLAYDRLQWVIQVRRGNPRPGRKDSYEGVSFVRRRKEPLLRVIQEKSITLTPEAMAKLDAMPGTFREWLDSIDSRGAGDA